MTAGNEKLARSCVRLIGSELMRQLLKLSVPMLAACFLLGACGSSKSSTATTSSSAAAGQATGSSTVTVKTASSSLGTILVNAQGMTLYHLSAEQNGKFICTSTACTGIWHPLTISAGSTPTGEASLSTVKRPDGTTQVTYKGTPLYTFASDQQPGETKGQGIKDVGTWSAVTTGGNASNSSTQTTAPSEGGSGGGYGY
jgi:predicted lipoprotein with Yx(FWY)xxD motif